MQSDAKRPRSSGRVRASNLFPARCSLGRTAGLVAKPSFTSQLASVWFVSSLTQSSKKSFPCFGRLSPCFWRLELSKCNCTRIFNLHSVVFVGVQASASRMRTSPMRSERQMRIVLSLKRSVWFKGASALAGANTLARKALVLGSCSARAVLSFGETAQGSKCFMLQALKPLHHCTWVGLSRCWACQLLYT